ncbi:transcription factor E3 [Trichonephila clavipes]|nr:transcription factor E3 [Trichonephila clavipes]
MESDTSYSNFSNDSNSADEEILPVEKLNNVFQTTTIKEKSNIKKVYLQKHCLSLHALAKDRQKKDNHNMSLFHFYPSNGGSSEAPGLELMTRQKRRQPTSSRP